MKTTFKIDGKKYKAKLKKGISISTPFYEKDHLPKAFHAPDLQIEAVRTDEWVGSTTEGGILNFKNVFINPHGNGTHTECVGHIATEPYYIKDCLRNSMVLGKLHTIKPEANETDTFISKEQVAQIDLDKKVKCLIIRTLPNHHIDKIKDWSDTNPTYVTEEAMKLLVSKGIKHFMIDVPSVDREHDEGKLLAHKAFWSYPSPKPRKKATITEMIYAPEDVLDGLYVVNIQTLPLAMDASPSNIILYPITQND